MTNNQMMNRINTMILKMKMTRIYLIPKLMNRKMMNPSFQKRN